MKRKLLDSLITLALLLAGAAGEALAQDDEGPDVDEHPFEVGAQLTFIGINFPERVVSGPPGSTASTVLPREHISAFGFGGRFAYNANQFVALEAEVSHFPERLAFEETFRSRPTQFLAGVRAGRRWEKVGAFAKGRIGALHFDEYGQRGPCTVTSPGARDCFDDARTFFATDLGGVVEYYPTRRTILRADAGDTIIRFRDVGPITFPPVGTFAGSSTFTRRETTHNFQLSFGLGFRF